MHPVQGLRCRVETVGVHRMSRGYIDHDHTEREKRELEKLAGRYPDYHVFIHKVADVLAGKDEPSRVRYELAAMKEYDAMVSRPSKSRDVYER